MSKMPRTRRSLFYLAGYLLVLGLGLLFFPRLLLRLLQSNGDYGDVFPRVAGMLMSGLGITVLGLIRVRAFELYPATLGVRVFFLVCLTAFYFMTGDPLFLVLVLIVALGFLLTISSLIFDRKHAS